MRIRTVSQHIPAGREKFHPTQDFEESVCSKAVSTRKAVGLGCRDSQHCQDGLAV